MTIAGRILRGIGACLAAAAMTVGALPASAGTVTNVATARWSANNTEFSIASNAVSFDVLERSASLSTYAVHPDGTTSADLQGSYCSSAIADRSAAAPTSSGAVVSLLPSNSFRVGQQLVIRVDAPQANLDPAVRERIELTLSTPDGDREILMAVEDAANRGSFIAAIDTRTTPPALVAGDCVLSISRSEAVSISATGSGLSLATAVNILADPYGLVFDSLTGRTIDGARVTLVDAATGQPAEVFAFDGVSAYPSSVVSGGEAIDSSGLVHSFSAGEFRFPLTHFGEYHLEIEPPGEYTAPSRASPAELAKLTAPDDRSFRIGDASFGGTFRLESFEPVRVDIPLDGPPASVSLRKTASRSEAEPGDAVFYTVELRNNSPTRPTGPIVLSDIATGGMRMRPDSVTLNGVPITAGLVSLGNGSGFSVAVGSLAIGEAAQLRYVMTVRPDAKPGEAFNRVTAKGNGDSDVLARAQTGVRIVRDRLTGYLTLIGRVTSGGCGDPAERIGLPGVRVMLEDGSFAITDADGRYHFDGIVPGTHVVQAASETLPTGGNFVDCTQSTMTAGSAMSRFATGQGGSLMRADFHAELPTGALESSVSDDSDREFLSDPAAAGAEIDWIALGDGPDGFVFPAIDHNPRSPVVRVVVRHRPGQSASLVVEGKPVDPLAFDGKTVSPDKRFAISVWRGIRLNGPKTSIVARIAGEEAATAQEFEQIVRFSAIPMRAQILPDRSQLVADGVNNPVIAVRLVDRFGYPVHSGISGTLQIDSPYRTLSSINAAQQRALSGFGDSSASWVVEGDDGIAYIELAPTMVSGTARLRFTFNDGDISRDEEAEAWLEPGDQPWTVIGLVEGTLGERSIAENMERGADFDSDLGRDARVALYAKGRVLGKYLLTLAYDSAKQKDDQRLLGTIDPAAYYTIYGDGSERLYDAASREKLYLRIESSTFYALYGDFQTGFDETLLGRYKRTATGAKAEARIGQVALRGFAAHTAMQHRRDEIQGNGLSGPYRLSSQAILANSETVAIEVRDRLRSNLVLARRELVRFVDYDIDLLTGTITFAEPVLSRDGALNPQFIVVDYETDGRGEKQWNAGIRGSWTSEDGKLRLGMTAVTDKGERARSNLLAADARLRLGATQVTVEAAASKQAGANAAFAYSAEVEHTSGPIDLLAYVREVHEDFGVDQQNLSDRGRRKFGADARLMVAENWTLIGRAWHEDSLIDDASRSAAELRIDRRGQDTDFYAAVAHLSDRFDDGTDGRSTVIEAGATQRLFGNRLELGASTSVTLAGAKAKDLPARHRLTARYRLTQAIKAIASYEIAKGKDLDARTLRGGVEVTPWSGGKFTTTIGQQALGADANRTFAAFALGQSLRVNGKLTFDATIDGNRTLGGKLDRATVYDPDHPLSSGGHLGEGGLIGEDFTAYTAGVTWTAGQWSLRGRGEFRDGELADRRGATLAAIRQLGDGQVLGGGFTWTRANASGGLETETMNGTLAFAYRPAGSSLSALSKLEYRSDRVNGAVAGEAGPAGNSVLLIDGDALSRRLIASVSTNWTPQGENAQRNEIATFVGLRHNLDRVEGFDLASTTLLGGVDLRIGLTEAVSVGGRANLRTELDGGATTFSIGPEISYAPAHNLLLGLGYNIAGFRDPDFTEARSTQRGVFANLRLKFDAGTLGLLGIGRN